MASEKAIVEQIIQQIDYHGEITFRSMFGEYGVYADGKFFAVVCDNQFYIKPTEGGRQFIQEPVEAPPYPGAKNYFLIDEQLDDPAWLGQLVAITVRELPPPKKKQKKK